MRITERTFTLTQIGKHETFLVIYAPARPKRLLAPFYCT